MSACWDTHHICTRPHIRKMFKGHRKCTTESCVINKIDTTNDVPKHVIGSCNYNRYKLSLENVIGSLSAGKIPIVQCPMKSYFPTTLLIHLMQRYPMCGFMNQGTRLRKEVLLACQIKRLTTLTRQLTLNGAFQIDALCVHVGKNMKKRAIGLMAKTYNKGKPVLVINFGIRVISISMPHEHFQKYFPLMGILLPQMGWFCGMTYYVNMY